MLNEIKPQIDLNFRFHKIQLTTSARLSDHMTLEMKME